MKKLLFFGILGLLNLNSAKAQIGVGLELGIAPNLDYENIYAGGGVKFDYFFKTNKRLSFSLGAYTSESLETLIVGGAGAVDYYYYSDIIPVNIGYQIDFGKSRFKPVFGLDAGLLFENYYTSFSDSYSFLETDETTSYLGLGLTLGARVELTEKLELNLTGRPQYYFGDYELPVIWVHLGLTGKF